MKMRVLPTVLTINVCLLLAAFLFTYYLAGAPQAMALFASVLAALNLVGVGLGMLDRKREFQLSFAAGFALAASVAAVAWILFLQYAEQIRDQMELNA